MLDCDLRLNPARRSADLLLARGLPHEPLERGGRQLEKWRCSRAVAGASECERVRERGRALGLQPDATPVRETPPVARFLGEPLVENEGGDGEFERRPLVAKTLEFYHGSEHLGKIREKVFGLTSQEGRRWFVEQRQRLRRSQGEEVVAAIEALAARRRGVRRLCEKEAGYFEHNLERMRYLTYRRRGWLIGSGAIEGGGKHLVTSRFKGNGRRWSVKRLPNFLALRVNVLNQREDSQIALRNAA